MMTTFAISSNTHQLTASANNDCLSSGDAREGSWSDDVCTHEHAVDAAVTQLARTIADQAFAVSDTGHDCYHLLASCVLAPRYLPPTLPCTPSCTVLQMDRRKSFDSRSRGTANAASPSVCLSLDPLRPPSSKSSRRHIPSFSPPPLTCPSKVELSATSVLLNFTPNFELIHFASGPSPTSSASALTLSAVAAVLPPAPQSSTLFSVLARCFRSTH